MRIVHVTSTRRGWTKAKHVRSLLYGGVRRNTKKGVPVFHLYQWQSELNLDRYSKVAYLLLSNDRTCRDIPPRVSLPVLLPSSFLPSQMLFFSCFILAYFGTFRPWKLDIIQGACSFNCPKPYFLQDLRDASFWNIITDFLSFYGTLVPPFNV